MTDRNQQKITASSLTEVKTEDGLIPIFPAGIVMGDDGRGPYNLNDPDAVIAASRRNNVDLVIDRDHAIDLSAPGTRIPAAGWIKELVNIDGAIWAKTEWTPAAEKELADKEYRYISPTFLYNPETRQVTRILRATLTNSPNFDMKAVASALTAPVELNQTPKENSMKIKAIAAALSMTNASDEEVLEAALKKIEAATQLEADYASVKTALNADEAAPVAAVLELAAAKNTADPALYVPIAAHTELAQKVAELQKAANEEKAMAAVDEAVKAGKVTPALKGWASGFALKDLAGFKEYVKAAPVIASQTDELGGKASPSTDGMSDHEIKEICQIMGIDPAEYKKTLEAERQSQAVS